MSDVAASAFQTDLNLYQARAQRTDRLSPTDRTPVLLGVFGEVGSLMATAKKLHREQKAFPLHREAATEEFGDALWYLAALARRSGSSLENLLKPHLASDYGQSSTESEPLDTSEQAALDAALLRLGSLAAGLLGSGDALAIEAFAGGYADAIRAARLDFHEVLRFNLAKIQSRFDKPDFQTLPTFDADFIEDERLPLSFEIHISQRASKKSYLRWNGVFIGDPLTDNIKDKDGYRFHDVFHLAHAAVLHWSPVVRALIKQKRKSISEVDEAQDGGRAIVVEEGLTAWLFSQAKSLDYFQGQDSVSYDILKTIGGFVKGYEVDQCPLALWETAILQGYAVFRQVRDNQGGIVIGDRTARTLIYRPLEVVT